MSIGKAQDDVWEFHERFDVPHPFYPQEERDVDWNRHRLRARWILSEVMEILEACDAQDMAALADGYVDVQYFAVGGHVELGVDGAPLWNAVHAANMLKVKIPGIEKIAKPEGWTPPDIAALIETQRNSGALHGAGF